MDKRKHIQLEAYGQNKNYQQLRIKRMTKSRITSFTSIAILGMSSMVLPVFFLDDLKHYD